DLLAHRTSSQADGVARGYQSPTGVGPGAPIEATRIAGDDGHIRHVAAKLVGDDLGEGGVVALTLAGNTGHREHSPARLAADVGAFDRPYSRPLAARRVADSPLSPITPRRDL